MMTEAATSRPSSVRRRALNARCGPLGRRGPPGEHRHPGEPTGARHEFGGAEGVPRGLPWPEMGHQRDGTAVTAQP